MLNDADHSRRLPPPLAPTVPLHRRCRRRLLPPSRPPEHCCQHLLSPPLKRSLFQLGGFLLGKVYKIQRIDYLNRVDFKADEDDSVPMPQVCTSRLPLHTLDVLDDVSWRGAVAPCAQLWAGLVPEASGS